MNNHNKIVTNIITSCLVSKFIKYLNLTSINFQNPLKSPYFRSDIANFTALRSF